MEAVASCGGGDLCEISPRRSIVLVAVSGQVWVLGLHGSLPSSSSRACLSSPPRPLALTLAQPNPLFLSPPCPPLPSIFGRCWVLVGVALPAAWRGRHSSDPPQLRAVVTQAKRQLLPDLVLEVDEKVTAEWQNSNLKPALFFFCFSSSYASPPSSRRRFERPSV